PAATPRHRYLRRHAPAPRNRLCRRHPCQCRREAAVHPDWNCKRLALQSAEERYCLGTNLAPSATQYFPMRRRYFPESPKTQSTSTFSSQSGQRVEARQVISGKKAAPGTVGGAHSTTDSDWTGQNSNWEIVNSACRRLPGDCTSGEVSPI